MKVLAAVLALMALAACEAGAPAVHQPPQTSPAETGISVSGTARAGVSHSF